jgi:FMN reductase
LKFHVRTPRHQPDVLSRLLREPAARLRAWIADRLIGGASPRSIAPDAAAPSFRWGPRRFLPPRAEFLDPEEDVMPHPFDRPLHAVGLSASPGGPASRSTRLLAHALARLSAAGLRTRAIGLRDLPADALLARTWDRALAEALDAAAAADVLVVATPIYRATYAGLLKVFFDQLKTGALARTVALPIATGGGPAHLLALDHGLRPLLASVGALVVSAGVYGADAQFTDTAIDADLLERTDRAVDEAVLLAAARRRAFLATGSLTVESVV